MAKKLTRAQQKRLVLSILSKTQKLYMTVGHGKVVDSKDMIAMEKMCNKFLKRLAYDK